jgi:hypothetical protein
VFDVEDTSRHSPELPRRSGRASSGQPIRLRLAKAVPTEADKVWQTEGRFNRVKGTSICPQFLAALDRLVAPPTLDANRKRA